MTEKHIGWRRVKGGRWRAVCEAPTREECWSLLIASRGPEHHQEAEVRRESEGPPPGPRARRKPR